MLVVVVHSLLLPFFIHFCSSFVDVLHSHLLFGIHPSPFRGLSTGFYTHFIISAEPISQSDFASLSFSIIPLFSCRGHYGFDWAFFYPWALFALCSFIGILRSFRRGLKLAVLSKGSYGFCFIHTISSYLERFIFKFYQTLSRIACGESLIYVLLTCFELFSLVQIHM